VLYHGVEEVEAMFWAKKCSLFFEGFLFPVAFADYFLLLQIAGRD
jgi:hypothetical protein